MFPNVQESSFQSNAIYDSAPVDNRQQADARWGKKSKFCLIKNIAKITGLATLALATAALIPVSISVSSSVAIGCLFTATWDAFLIATATGTVGTLVAARVSFVSLRSLFNLDFTNYSIKRNIDTDIIKLSTYEFRQLKKDKDSPLYRAKNLRKNGIIRKRDYNQLTDLMSAYKKAKTSEELSQIDVRWKNVQNHLVQNLPNLSK